MQETRVWPLGQEDILEKGMATHSSILAWKFSWTEDPDRLSPQGGRESDTTEWLTLLLLAELFIFQLICAVLIKYKCFIHIILVDVPRNPIKLELLPSVCIWGKGSWEKLQNFLRTFSNQVIETEFWANEGRLFFKHLFHLWFSLRKWIFPTALLTCLLFCFCFTQDRLCFPACVDTEYFFGWGGEAVSCGILVPQPGVEPAPSAVKAWSPNPLYHQGIPYAEFF